MNKLNQDSGLDENWRQKYKTLQANKQGVSLGEFTRLEKENTDSGRIKRAMESVSGGYVDFPPGEYVIDKPIVLKRGYILRGLGSMDTDISRGVTIKLANNSNCSIIVTQAGNGGDSTHYIGMENLVINGNSDNQRNEQVGVRFEGVWIGSWMKNILITNVFGPGLSIDKHADVQLDHIWVIGCITDRYGVEINNSINSGQQGYINIDHLYVENTIKSSYKGQSPTNLVRNVPDSRGKGILINRVASVIIHEMHQEGHRYGVDLSSNHSVQIENLTCTHMGNTQDKDHAYIRLLDDDNNVVMLGTGTHSQSEKGYSFLKKASGVTSNHYRDLPEEMTYLSGYIGGRWDKNVRTVLPSTDIINKVSLISAGNYSPIDMKFHTTGKRDKYHSIVGDGESLIIRSNLENDESDDFIEIRQTGNYDKNVHIKQPLRLPDRTSDHNIQNGTIYIQNGTARIRQSDETQSIITARTGSGVPKFNAHFIGQTYIDITNRQAYIAVNLDTGSRDWKQITN